MKIYFEDGQLCSKLQRPHDTQFTLDATYGPSENIKFLDTLNESNPNAVIYTNSIFAFSNTYAWNSETNKPEVYIRAGEHMIFTPIYELTRRNLRYCENIKKLYLNGEFNSFARDDAVLECAGFISGIIMNHPERKLNHPDIWKYSFVNEFSHEIISDALNALIDKGVIYRVKNQSGKVLYRLCSDRDNVEVIKP